MEYHVVHNIFVWSVHIIYTLEYIINKYIWSIYYEKNEIKQKHDDLFVLFEEYRDECDESLHKNITFIHFTIFPRALMATQSYLNVWTSRLEKNTTNDRVAEWVQTAGGECSPIAKNNRQQPVDECCCDGQHVAHHRHVTQSVCIIIIAMTSLTLVWWSWRMCLLAIHHDWLRSYQTASCSWNTHIHAHIR